MAVPRLSSIPFLSRPLNVVLLAYIVVAASIAVTGGASVQLLRSPASLYITHWRTCIYDVECGDYSYCKKDLGSGFVGRCARRIALGGSCSSSTDCVQNAFCKVAMENKCMKQGALNDTCNPVQKDPCQAGLTCESTVPCTIPPTCDGPVGKCRPRKPGRAGASCSYDRDCAQNDGFYCRNRDGVCAAKFPDGTPCDLAIDKYECEGFCLTDTMPGTAGGVCVPAQRLGGLCTEDTHCEAPFAETLSRDPVMCNKANERDLVGRCARVSMLQHTLGAPCEIGYDLCDAQRGLRCYWVEHWRWRGCQHRPFPDKPGSPTPYCRQGSKLSRCPGPPLSAPTVCRTTRVLPWEQPPGFPTNEDTFTTCAPKRRHVPVGARCDQERDTCPAHAECRLVPGLLLMESFGPGAVSRDMYCVRVLRASENCGDQNKFRAICGDGLQCRHGKCIPVGFPASPIPTHGGLGGSCKNLPCAPGLACASDKICDVKKKMIGLDGLCDDDANSECKAGLVCRTHWDAHGRRRCRTPRGSGAFCENDGWCKPPLRCPILYTPGRAARERRCYAPESALWLGEECDPSKESSGRRCATVQVGFGPDQITKPLRCLRRKDVTFQCLVDAGPFGRCDEEKKWVCGDTRFECRGGVCIPKIQGDIDEEMLP